MVVLLLGWPECMEIRLFRGVSATKSRLRRAVFVFWIRGPGPLRLRAGAHLTRNKEHSADLSSDEQLATTVGTPYAAYTRFYQRVERARSKLSS